MEENIQVVLDVAIKLAKEPLLVVAIITIAALAVVAYALHAVIVSIKK